MSLLDPPPSFWEHVEELRSTLIKCLLAVALAAAAAFLCFDQIYPLITSPLKSQRPLTKSIVIKQRLKNSRGVEQTIQKPPGTMTSISKGSGFTEEGFVILPPDGVIEWEVEKDPTDLILLGPMEGIASSLKISLWTGLFLSSPFCSYFLLQFIFPALRRKEKLFALPFAFFSLLFLFLGALFAHTVTIPFTNDMLSRYNESMGLNFWTVSNYINYTIIMTLSSGIAFEIALILLFLVHYGKISEPALKRFRPISYVGAFVLSAFLTPPDIFTQICLALPLIGIYEIAIIYAKIRVYFLMKLLKNMD